MESESRYRIRLPFGGWGDKMARCYVSGLDDTDRDPSSLGNYLYDKHVTAACCLLGIEGSNVIPTRNHMR